MPEDLPGLRVRRALLGPELTPVDNVWLRFEDGSITAVGTGRPPVALPEEPGSVALPGLVDCHVHLAMSGSADVQSEVSRLDDTTAAEAVRRNAQAQVLSGVTTVRDLGSPNDVVVKMADQLKHGADPAPTVIAGGAVAHPSGHGHFLGRHAEGVDGYRAAVADVAAIGARVVKLFATGGVVTHGTRPGAPQMTFEELQAAVAAARQYGLPVAAHAHGLEGIRNAVAAGVDSVEHFSYLTPDVVAALADTRTWLVSTLVATQRFASSERREEASPETLQKILAHAPHERAALQLAVASHCRMAAGTDAGTTFNPHGWGMQEQAALLASAGLSIKEVLRTLTVRGAQLVGEPAGVLAEGRRADLLVVGGDPLEDLAALSRPEAVIVRGRRIELRR